MNDLAVQQFGGVSSMADTVEPRAEESLELRLEGLYLPLLRLAVLVAANRADGEDALQAALERAWRSREQLRDPAALEAWLRQIVVREVIRRQSSPWRRLVRPAEPLDVSILDMSSRDGLDPDLRLSLAAALARLPAPQRAVVVLHHYAGYRVDEVAQIVDAPLETVRSRLRLAMARLRTEMER